jgi:hypothetical protein
MFEAEPTLKFVSSQTKWLLTQKSRCWMLLQTTRLDANGYQINSSV